MIRIMLNGKARDLPAGATLQTLLEDLELTGRRVAIEVNREIIPRSQHAAHTLNEGDKVEVVHAIGGG